MLTHWKAIAPIALLALVPSRAYAAGDQRLVEAAKNRDQSAVRRLLEQHVDVNTPYGDGTTALHWAAYWDDQEIVDLLIRAKASVNSTTDLGVSPLALAGENGSAVIVEKLLKAGADPNTATITGVTTLMRAARAGHASTAAMLLEYGASVDARESSRDQTALMWAVGERHPDVVRVLLDYGADVTLRSRSTKQMVLLKPANDASGVRSVKTARQIGAEVARGGGTPLMFAAWVGDLESARLLVTAGANVNDQADDGSSAVVAAIHGGYTAVALYLLDKGANPNGSRNSAALHVAALRGDLIAVQALLTHGANPNARITDGMPVRRFGLEWVIPATHVGATPLIVAANYLDANIIQALLAGGADPNLGMDDGTTALMAAAGVGGRLRRPAVSSAEAVCLNSAGFTVPCSDVDAAAGGGQGEGPAAQSNLEPQVLAASKMLAAAGANVNALNADGESALHGAASAALPRVIQFLIGSGAEPNVKNKRGKSPLRLAIDANIKDPKAPDTTKSVELLRSLGALE